MSKISLQLTENSLGPFLKRHFSQLLWARVPSLLFASPPSKPLTSWYMVQGNFIVLNIGEKKSDCRYVDVFLKIRYADLCHKVETLVQATSMQTRCLLILAASVVFCQPSTFHSVLPTSEQRSNPSSKHLGVFCKLFKNLPLVPGPLL